MRFAIFSFNKYDEILRRRMNEKNKFENIMKSKKSGVPAPKNGGNWSDVETENDHDAFHNNDDDDVYDIPNEARIGEDEHQSKIPTLVWEDDEDEGRTTPMPGSSRESPSFASFSSSSSSSSSSSTAIAMKFYLQIKVDTLVALQYYKDIQEPMKNKEKNYFLHLMLQPIFLKLHLKSQLVGGMRRVPNGASSHHHDIDILVTLCDQDVNLYVLEFC